MCGALTVLILYLELTSTKAAGEFEIALSLLEHCEAQPIPLIFSFKQQKCKGKSSAILKLMAQNFRSLPVVCPVKTGVGWLAGWL